MEKLNEIAILSKKLNQIKIWQQGEFIDSSRYRNMPMELRIKRSREEKLLVRPHPTGNAICYCNEPQFAIWIAKRLNLASMYEQRISSPCHKCETWIGAKRYKYCPDCGCKLVKKEAK